MSKTSNIWIQVLATIGQIANVWGAYVPPQYVPYVAGGLATAQLITSAVAHYYNPDGTKATLPYTPTSAPPTVQK